MSEHEVVSFKDIARVREILNSSTGRLPGRAIIDGVEFERQPDGSYQGFDMRTGEPATEERIAALREKFENYARGINADRVIRV